MSLPLKRILIAAGVVIVFLAFALIRDAGTEFPDTLTLQEREWISAHPTIVVAPDPDRRPIEYLDENADYRGLAADYLTLIGNHLGLKFKVLHLPDREKIFENIKRKQIDMLGAVTETPQRMEYMRFTRPYIELPAAIIVRDDLRESLVPEKMNGMKVAVVSGNAECEYIQNHFPLLQLDRVPNLPTGLSRVSSGLADAFVADSASAVHYMEKEGINNLRIAGSLGYSVPLAFGVRDDWPELVGILEKGLNQIGVKERKGIFQKWVHLREASLFGMREFWLTILSIFSLGGLIIVALLAWNRSLKSLVKQRTEALEAIQEGLERRVAERTNELVETNTALLAEVVNRSEAEKALIESRQMLQTILDTIPTRVFWKDLNSTYLGCNQSFAIDAGFQSADEVVGKTDCDMIWSTQADHFQTEDRRIIATGQGRLGFEEPLLKGLDTGNWVRTNKVPLLGSGGRIRGVLGTYDDITTEKIAEEALLESQQRLEHIIDFLPDATLVIDGEGKVIAWNRAMENMTGVMAGDMLGKGDHEYALPFYGERRPILIDLVLLPWEEVEKEYLGIERRGGVDRGGSPHPLTARERDVFSRSSECSFRFQGQHSGGNRIGPRHHGSKARGRSPIPG